MTDKLAWNDVEPLLQDLRLRADALKEEFPDEADFTPRFADLADSVLEAANNDAWHHASVAVTDILIELGYVPADHRQH